MLRAVQLIFLRPLLPAGGGGAFSDASRRRWLTLLVASSIFYAAFIPAYLLVLYGMIAVDYVAGLLIERAAGGRLDV